jgi:retron-type reverse transcriptase
MPFWAFLVKGRAVGELKSFNMIEKVDNRKNLYKAYRQVVRNKGSAGVDGMNVTELLSYL